jgi:serine/threonine protein kinase
MTLILLLGELREALRMSDDLDRPDAPPSPLRQIDLVADSFKQEWRLGICPRIPDHLDKVPAGLRARLLVELICIDLEHRLRNKLSVTLEDYFREFPELDGLPPTERADLERQCADCQARVGPLEGVSGGLVTELRQVCIGGAALRDSRAQAVGDQSAGGPEEPGHPPPELGQVGGYQLLKKIGGGSFGAVYLARGQLLQRLVAIKVLHERHRTNTTVKARFLQEMRAIGHLTAHPNVAQAFQASEEDGTLFLVMEYVEGIDLDGMLEKQGALPVADACEVVRQAALGLQYVHEHGLVHRDIKPGNLMLARANPHRVKVLDLGLARLLEESAQVNRGTGYEDIIGTFDYMAPEQAKDARQADYAADIYSLGCTFYHLLTGQVPFPGNNKLEKLEAHRTRQPALLVSFQREFPKGLQAVLSRMLAKKPAERHRAAFAVAADLEPFCKGASLGGLLGSKETPTSAETKLPKLIFRKKLVLTSCVLAAVAVVGGWLAFYSASRKGGGSAGTAEAGENGLTTGEIRGGTPGAAVSSPFKGWIDVKVYSGQPGRHDRTLAEEGVVPLRRDDPYKLFAEVEPAGYLYVLSIDTEGAVAPVYPWRPGEWGTRPTQEKPLTRLRLPPEAEEGWKLEVPDDGMHTFILLVRTTPLDLSDDKLRNLLAGLPPQRPWPGREAAIWFENGKEVKEEAGRQRRDWKTVAIHSPVLRLQSLFEKKLQPYAAYTRAVSFAAVKK